MNEPTYRQNHWESESNTGQTTLLRYEPDRLPWYRTPVRSSIDFVADRLGTISGIGSIAVIVYLIAERVGWAYIIIDNMRILLSIAIVLAILCFVTERVVRRFQSQNIRSRSASYSVHEFDSFRIQDVSNPWEGYHSSDLPAKLTSAYTCELPDRLIQRNTIANMQVGDERYVVPWALLVNEYRECFLIGTQVTSHRPGGTIRMRIELTKNGFVVYTPPGEYWQPRDRDYRENLLPVYRVY